MDNHVNADCGNMTQFRCLHTFSYVFKKLAFKLVLNRASKTPIFRTTAGEFTRSIGKDGLKRKLTDYVHLNNGERRIKLQDDHETGWEEWEENYGVTRSDFNGATFFYTTLTDLVGYIQSHDSAWTNDDADDWLIIITDAHKFDDDPWPISDELPNHSSLPEWQICQTLCDLRSIYEKRYVFGTSRNIDGVDNIQQRKFQSIVANDHRQCASQCRPSVPVTDDIFEYEGTVDGWAGLPQRTRQAKTVNELLCCNQLDVTIKRDGRVQEKRRAFLTKNEPDYQFGCHSFTSATTNDKLTIGPFGWNFNGIENASPLVTQDKCCPKSEINNLKIELLFKLKLKLSITIASTKMGIGLISLEMHCPIGLLTVFTCHVLKLLSKEKFNLVLNIVIFRVSE